ncbi:transmembrane protein, putative [Bodo saltans]|uniref:Transmembrane protein, putative n=1 Tax=Bodo saltans TaxID=75058 RepID=A0A0S4JBU6_BODSA|nr:transmembrane protein, putative [Bodo saltans]|eukprot:CUG88878.1 transmembrane protein, putative [Bodo saltans]
MNDTSSNCSTSSSVSLNYSVDDYQWWACCLGAVACLLMSGLASGINIGLMSLSPLSLRLLVDAAPAEKRRDPKLRLQARRATKVLPLVARKHLVLVTLLLTTAIADEVLPLCIDAIAPTWVAVVVSVTTMLLFTEVIPTALFTDHRSNLKLASALAPFVWTLLGVLGIVTWPMAKLLTVFVERTHKRVGDAESAAGSIKADEVDEEKVADKDRTQVETRQLLKASRFTALLHLLRKEASSSQHKTKKHSHHHSSSNPVMDVTQICLLERVIALGRVRVCDVMEPLASSPRLLNLDAIINYPGPWTDALAMYCARNCLHWFVVEGLHGTATWDIFETAAVLKAGGQVGSTIVDALLECCPSRYEQPLVVSEASYVCDAETLRRTMAPHASVALVHAAAAAADETEDGRSTMVGVVHLLDAIRARVVDTTYWVDEASRHHSTVVSSTAAAPKHSATAAAHTSLRASTLSERVWSTRRIG